MLSILGSTGSIGVATLEVAKHLGVRVEALAAGSNVALLKEQIEAFSPSVVGVYDEGAARQLQELCPGIEIVAGMEGLLAVAERGECVVSAIVGAMGIEPTAHAIRRGKRIALANKETLVAAGDYIMNLAETYQAEIIPVDSEHSAIFQCLQGMQGVGKLILTASGGPFRTRDDLSGLTAKEALKHPTWVMGPKVTIDSSTLMNKGLEFIEAMHLFNMPPEKIEVVIHPQSIVHSMVEGVDGSVIAQMSPPSMKLPIQYAITYPKRLPGIAPCFNFGESTTLTFDPPDLDRFICLKLAMEAARVGKSLPCFMNAANEVIVSRFLRGEMLWNQIGETLEGLMQRHQAFQVTDIEGLKEVDAEARQRAMDVTC